MKWVLVFAGLLACGTWIYFQSQENERAVTTSADTENLEVTAEKVVSTPPPQIDLVDGPDSDDSRIRTQMQKIKNRFYAGDYASTLAMIEKDLAEFAHYPNYLTWLREQLPVVLTSLGWLNAKLAKCEIAEKQFRRSLTFAPLPDTHKGLAYCLYKLKKVNQSARYFEKYFKLRQKDPSMRQLYADVLESQGRFDLAVSQLAIVLKTDEEGIDKDLVKKSLKAMKERKKEDLKQSTLSTTHFLIRYRLADHDGLVDQFAETLESTIVEFTERYGFRAPISQVEVTFYPDDQFQNLVQHSPTWAQGIFDGRIRIPIPSTIPSERELEVIHRTLRHELVHALLAQMVDQRTVPSWFNEGLAQRLECNGCGQTQFPLVTTGMLKRQTFEESFIGFNPQKARAAYIQSLYLILTLEKEMGRDDAFYQIVSSLNRYSSLDSDSILSPLGLKFETLRNRAALKWQNQEIYRW